MRAQLFWFGKIPHWFQTDCVGRGEPFLDFFRWGYKLMGVPHSGVPNRYFAVRYMRLGLLLYSDFGNSKSTASRSILSREDMIRQLSILFSKSKNDQGGIGISRTLAGDNRVISPVRGISQWLIRSDWDPDSVSLSPLQH